MTSVFLQPVAVSATAQLAMTALWAVVLLIAGGVLAWQARRNLSIKRLRAIRIVDALLLAVALASLGHVYFMAGCDVAPVCCWGEYWEYLCYIFV